MTDATEPKLPQTRAEFDAALRAVAIRAGKQAEVIEYPIQDWDAFARSIVPDPAPPLRWTPWGERHEIARRGKDDWLFRGTEARHDVTAKYMTDAQMLAAASQIPAEPVEITDAMVDAAEDAYHEPNPTCDMRMRAALAAVASQLQPRLVVGVETTQLRAEVWKERCLAAEKRAEQAEAEHDAAILATQRSTARRVLGEVMYASTSPTRDQQREALVMTLYPDPADTIIYGTLYVDAPPATEAPR